MDNAAYHKRVEDLNGGISTLRKQELINWMKNVILNFLKNKTKKDIYAMSIRALEILWYSSC